MRRRARARKSRGRHRVIINSTRQRVDATSNGPEEVGDGLRLPETHRTIDIGNNARAFRYECVCVCVDTFNGQKSSDVSFCVNGTRKPHLPRGRPNACAT